MNKDDILSVDSIADELKKTNVGKRAHNAKARKRQKKEKELRDAVTKVLDSLKRRMNQKTAKHQKPILVMKNACRTLTDVDRLPEVERTVYRLLEEAAPKSGWHPILQWNKKSHNHCHYDLCIEFR